MFKLDAQKGLIFRVFFYKENCFLEISFLNVSIMK